MSMLLVKKMFTKILEELKNLGDRTTTNENRLTDLGNFVVQDYSSGSMKSINKSGLYYIYNAVTDKPMNSGGLFAVKFSNAASLTGSGIFLVNANSTGNFAYRVSIIGGTWYYHTI